MASSTSMPIPEPPDKEMNRRIKANELYKAHCIKEGIKIVNIESLTRRENKVELWGKKGLVAVVDLKTSKVKLRTNE